MGVYDIVIFHCPTCGQRVEAQSKAGSCDLIEYWDDEIPISIAQDLNKTILDCEMCGVSFRIKIPKTTVTYTSMIIEGNK